MYLIFFKGAQYLVEVKQEKKPEEMEEANEKEATEIGTFFMEVV